VAASAATGKLYVAYQDVSAIGMIYCLNIYSDEILWNRAIDPDVDRLAMNPDGQSLYVPTWEGGSSDYTNVVDAATGEAVRRGVFLQPIARHSVPGIRADLPGDEGERRHRPLPVFDRSEELCRIKDRALFGDPRPLAVDSTSSYAVNNVRSLWGMEVVNLKTGLIITAGIPDHPPGDPGLLHGIGWTPDESEVWQSSAWSDPHVYVWAMGNRMAPVLKDRLTLRSWRGSHWLTFDLKGDYGYVAPYKNSADGTEIFDVRTHASVGMIGSSEDLLEIDFANGRITQIGDQYGIGRR